MAARLKTANRSCQSLWSEYLFSKKKQRGQSVRMVDHEADVFWRVGIIGRTFWQDSRCRSETHYDIHGRANRRRENDKVEKHFMSSAVAPSSRPASVAAAGGDQMAFHVNGQTPATWMSHV
jgi:hypothetical protein